MTTGTFYPSESGDDGYVVASSLNPYGYGVVGMNDYDGSFDAFIRFRNVTIPQGSTISSAKITLYSPYDRDCETVNVRIYGNAADNATAPTTDAEYAGTALTTAYADWDDIGAWVSESSYDSVDISDVIEEIVGRSGWSSGNSLLILLTDNGSSILDTEICSAADRYWHQYDSGTPYPALSVDWSASSEDDKIIDATPPGMEISVSLSGVPGPSFPAPEMAVAAALTASDAWWGQGGVWVESQITVTLSGSVTPPAALDRDMAIKRYYCTITGDADGIGDIVIPITSLQVRKRDDGQSYCQVTVPGMDYAGAINARSNGDIAVHVGYVQAGSEVLRELLLRVDLDSIRVDQGPINQTITLSGYTTIENDTPKSVSLAGVTYQADYADGRRMWRTAIVNPDIVPGDTVTWDGLSIVSGTVTYTINARSQTMEITEAES